MVADNKLVDCETREEYQTDVANRFSALEGLEIPSEDDTWVKIRDSIKASAKEKVGININIIAGTTAEIKVN